ncbi:hypothetical protein PQO01_16560 [Lentisphaera marina]|uniref:hypothetical protein n=1 Tax=Lentisphaera marina TaxID=1111041 RepID=UPI00236670B3|nr:hypothetical protein [Lentisphaera marina]MDD7986564.1 hypothetical protein [Lentisphaera marina]
MSTDQQQLRLTREEKDFIQTKINKVNELEALIQQGKVDQTSTVKEIDQLLEEIAQVTDQALERSSENDIPLEAKELPLLKSTQNLGVNQNDLINKVKQETIQKNLSQNIDKKPSQKHLRAQKNNAWDELFKEEEQEEVIYEKARSKKKKLKVGSRKVTRSKPKRKAKSSLLKICFTLAALACTCLWAYDHFLNEYNLIKQIKFTISQILEPIIK